MGYRRSEPPELEFQAEEPTVLPEIIRLHLEDLGYGLSDLADALHSTENDLRTLHPVPRCFEASSRRKVECAEITSQNTGAVL